jgi:ATP-binding cassette, subfamily C, bacterial CydCD
VTAPTASRTAPGEPDSEVADARPPAELGAPLPGQRLRDRPSRPPVDPRLLRFDPAVPRLLAFGAVLSFVTALALIVQATALGAIVARTFLGDATLADHTGWLWWLGAAVLVRAAATWTTQVLAHRTAARVKSGLRRAVVARLARRPPGATEQDTGALASALTDGIDALDGTFGGYLPALLSGIIVPVTIVVYVVTIDPTSAVVLLVTLPLIPIFMVLIGLAARSATRRRFRALTGLSGQLLTVLQGLTAVKVARAGDRVGAAVRGAAERLRRTTLETLRVAFLSALALELLAALSVATVAVIAGVRLAEATGIGFEPVLIALLLAPEAFWPLRQVGAQFHANEDGAAAADRLLDLLEDGEVASPGVAAVDAAVVLSGSGLDAAVAPPDPATTAVRLEGVTVRYPDRATPALGGVDLELVPGERLAILGASGAGKTTLAAVLLGLRPPDVGRVVVGATELASVPSTAWHDQLAWVPQRPAPLRGTLREVVTLGTEVRPADPQVWAALRAVAMDGEVAALPGGLDTVIGAGGRGLSAGQWRRLAIARALLRPAGLVVLDEPTGDLDVDAEQAVRGAIEILSRTRTVVVLTHRIALADTGDRVVVLEEGRVVDEGRPQDLRDGDGPYARLVHAAGPLTVAEVAPDRATLGPSIRRSVAAAAGSGTAADVAAASVAATADPSPADTSQAVPPRWLDADPGEPSWRTQLRQVTALLAPHRRPLALAVGAGALTPLAGVLLVAVSTYLISRTALRPNLLDLTAVIVSVRSLSILKGLSRYVERLAGHDVALRVVVDLRHHAYLRLLPQAPAGLARWRSGDVLARVVADVERLQLALVRGVLPMLGGILASLVLVLIATVLLPAAGPILLVGLAAAGLLVPVVALRLARRPEQRLALARGALTAELVELLQAAPELRLLGQLEPAERRVTDLDTEVVAADRSGVARLGGSDAVVQLVLGATVIGLVLVGVPAVVAGSLDGVLLASLLVLALAAAEAVGPLPMASRALVTAGTAAARLREVLEVPPPAPDPVAGVDGAPVAAPGPLVLDRATASYPGSSTPAVHDLTLTLSPGRRVAVVGRSGAGKSTLAALTVRFLDPDSGQVLLADTALSELTGDDVRDQVALSPQDAHVLAGTIVDELRLAAPDADDAELQAALTAARLEELVAELPRGWDTPIGENGSRLSGGQRHRLALARTLLVGAPLLVLDEPTADLDAVTGRAFLSDALSSAGERGVLLLTHDLRALPIVDEVAVVEAGRIVARGTHEELLASDPAYAARIALEFAGR